MKQFDPRFTPDLTPKQMLELGVFGGAYFGEDKKEYPKSWFAHAKLSSTDNPKCNFFGVRASQPFAVWQQKGWIHPQDPRGWFQWYCRYYLGRRTPEEDERQIKRWVAIRRHIVQLQKTAAKVTLRADQCSGRRSFIGRMIAGSCSTSVSSQYT